MKSSETQTLQKGKYILQQELGQGGFGITYKAFDQKLNQVVVIKTLKVAPSQQTYLGNLRKQFEDEARRLAKISHPNIVRYREFFIERELPYIVMDYIPGQTLDALVLPHNPLPEATAINYMRQVGEALKVVHNNGLLHRDLKPQNLILHQDSQQVVLIDFGIAREFSSGVTQTHTNLISEGYAPIEQYLPKAKRTPATDVYGLAATLYTLLTAQVPVASVLRDRLDLESPKDIRPELSERISWAVMWGMEMELSQRPATVEEWLTILPRVSSQVNTGALVSNNSSVSHRLNLLPEPPPTQRESTAVVSKIKSLVLTVVSAFAGVLLGLSYYTLSKVLEPSASVPANELDSLKKPSTAESVNLKPKESDKTTSEKLTPFKSINSTAPVPLKSISNEPESTSSSTPLKPTESQQSKTTQPTSKTETQRKTTTRKVQKTRSTTRYAPQKTTTDRRRASTSRRRYRRGDDDDDDDDDDD